MILVIIRSTRFTYLFILFEILLFSCIFCSGFKLEISKGWIIIKVRFANDTAFIAGTQEKLQGTVNRLADTRRKYGMEINLTNHKY